MIRCSSIGRSFRTRFYPRNHSFGPINGIVGLLASSQRRGISFEDEEHTPLTRTFYYLYLNDYQLLRLFAC